MVAGWHGVPVRHHLHLQMPRLEGGQAEGGCSSRSKLMPCLQPLGPALPSTAVSTPLRENVSFGNPNDVFCQNKQLYCLPLDQLSTELSPPRGQSSRVALTKAPQGSAGPGRGGGAGVQSGAQRMRRLRLSPSITRARPSTEQRASVAAGEIVFWRKMDPV